MDQARIKRLLSFWRGIYADRGLLSPSMQELVHQTIETLEDITVEVTHAKEDEG